jgi:anti-sigma regulatory factor (Ser/Thr protein kinase)
VRAVSVIPGTIDAPRRARQLVMATLVEAACTPDSIEAARVLVSELVTNAVVHARSPSIRVEVVVHEPSFRVSVHDDEPNSLPSPERVPPDALGGRGLLLVEHLASRWASEVCDDPVGKVVWFEMACA